MVTNGGRVGGGIDWEFGIDMYTLLHLKEITNKDLLSKKKIKNIKDKKKNK